MGFERVTSIIQGTKGFTDFKNARISNYETDIFRLIFDELEKLSGKKYCSTLPQSSGSATVPVASVGVPPTESCEGVRNEFISATEFSTRPELLRGTRNRATGTVALPKPLITSAACRTSNGLGRNTW
jgi:hypothetical protein